MNWLVKLFGSNWKTNTAAAIVFVLSCPAFIDAFTRWAHHQPADWREALAGLAMSIGLAVAKDSSTHSTSAEVAAATNAAQGNHGLDV
ncbi:MAG: hypothetical protein ABSG02_14515 [Terriglobales bacterium]|jgi:hypothetical protein